MRFPRSGCQTCRDRRIKCDETQPVCQKCVKSRRTCYGMRTGGEIHIENAYASGQQKRPRGPRPASTQNSERAISSIKPPPGPDLKSTAIIFYVNSYMQTLQDSPDLSKGTIDAVFPVFKARPDTPMLSLAISSMALAVFSRTHHCHPAAVAASNQYSQLLKLSSKTVLSITSENVDDCLFAIFFMGRYEDAVHQVQDTGMDPLDNRNPLKSFSHHAGASAVLKIWKERLSSTHQATETIKYSRRGLIRSAFMRGLAIPEFMADGALYGERGLELEYDSILVQMASIRWRTSLLANADSDTVNASSELRAIADRLCRDTLQLDDAMEEWAGSFDIHWRYERHTLPSPQLWPSEDFFTNEVLTYRNPYFAAIWNQYYSTRMLLNSLRLRILKVSGMSEDESTFGQRLACLSKMKAMANDMAASLPYCLEKLKITDTLEAPHRKVFTLNSSEDVKPYISTLIVWPLGIAARVADLDTKQKVWFRSVLTRVGSKLGYGILQCPQDKYWVDF